MQESAIAEGNAEAVLPRCSCTGCNSKDHRAGKDGPCEAAAGEQGTVYCAACSVANAETAEWQQGA